MKKSTSVEDFTFRILGPLEIFGSGQTVKLPAGRQQVILAMLLLEANHIVPSDRLVDAVWGTEPPSTARTQIHVCISALRRLFAGLGKRDAIVTRPPGYSLRVGPWLIDADVCSALVARARLAAARGANAECVAMLRSALDLYQGEVLAGLSSPLIAAKATRLQEERLLILEECLDRELQLGRHRELVGELRDVASQHPLRERLQSLLMLALYRSGRQAEALEVYRETRRRLVGELGIEPGDELRDLERAVLAKDRDLLIEPGRRGGPGSLLDVVSAAGRSWGAFAG